MASLRIAALAALATTAAAQTFSIFDGDYLMRGFGWTTDGCNAAQMLQMEGFPDTVFSEKEKKKISYDRAPRRKTIPHLRPPPLIVPLRDLGRAHPPDTGQFPFKPRPPDPLPGAARSQRRSLPLSLLIPPFTFPRDNVLLLKTPISGETEILGSSNNQYGTRIHVQSQNTGVSYYCNLTGHDFHCPVQIFQTVSIPNMDATLELAVVSRWRARARARARPREQK